MAAIAVCGGSTAPNSFEPWLSPSSPIARACAISKSASRRSREALSHGLSTAVKRSTLADANETRDWRICADFAQRLIAQARALQVRESRDRTDETVYALDATTIDLCLSLFPWAPFRSTKAAIKLHTLLDLRGTIPSFIHISDGKLHDVNALDMLVIEPGAIYVMDRGYLDFERLYALDQAALLRHPRQIESRCPSPLFSRSDRAQASSPTRPSSSTATTSQLYPAHLRRIRFKDPETDKTLVFLTNHFAHSPQTIAALYKARWQVELFFKWIKQHLRIKHFYGTPRMR